MNSAALRLYLTPQGLSNHPSGSWLQPTRSRRYCRLPRASPSATRRGPTHTGTLTTLGHGPCSDNRCEDAHIYANKRLVDDNGEHQPCSSTLPFSAVRDDSLRSHDGATALTCSGLSVSDTHPPTRKAPSKVPSGIVGCGRCRIVGAPARRRGFTHRLQAVFSTMSLSSTFRL